MAIFNKILAAVIFQEYTRAANNAKKKVLVVANNAIKKGISSSLLGIKELLITSGYYYKS